MAEAKHIPVDEVTKSSLEINGSANRPSAMLVGDDDLVDVEEDTRIMHAMSYKGVQSLAVKYRLPANLKKEDMVTLLAMRRAGRLDELQAKLDGMYLSRGRVVKRSANSRCSSRRGTGTGSTTTAEADSATASLLDYVDGGEDYEEYGVDCEPRKRRRLDEFEWHEPADDEICSGSFQGTGSSRSKQKRKKLPRAISSRKSPSSVSGRQSARGQQQQQQPQGSVGTRMNKTKNKTCCYSFMASPPIGSPSSPSPSPFSPRPAPATSPSPGLGQPIASGRRQCGYKVPLSSNLHDLGQVRQHEAGSWALTAPPIPSSSSCSGNQHDGYGYGPWQNRILETDFSLHQPAPLHSAHHIDSISSSRHVPVAPRYQSSSTALAPVTAKDHSFSSSRADNIVKLLETSEVHYPSLNFLNQKLGLSQLDSFSTHAFSVIPAVNSKEVQLLYFNSDSVIESVFESRRSACSSGSVAIVNLFRPLEGTCKNSKQLLPLLPYWKPAKTHSVNCYDVPLCPVESNVYVRAMKERFPPFGSNLQLGFGYYGSMPMNQPHVLVPPPSYQWQQNEFDPYWCLHPPKMVPTASPAPYCPQMKPSSFQAFPHINMPATAPTFPTSQPPPPPPPRPLYDSSHVDQAFQPSFSSGRTSGFQPPHQLARDTSVHQTPQTALVTPAPTLYKPSPVLAFKTTTRTALPALQSAPVEDPYMDVNVQVERQTTQLMATLMDHSYPYSMSEPDSASDLSTHQPSLKSAQPRSQDMDWGLQRSAVHCKSNQLRETPTQSRASSPAPQLICQQTKQPVALALARQPICRPVPQQVARATGARPAPASSQQLQKCHEDLRARARRKQRPIPLPSRHSQATAARNKASSLKTSHPTPARLQAPAPSRKIPLPFSEFRGKNNELSIPLIVDFLASAEKQVSPPTSSEASINSAFQRSNQVDQAAHSRSLDSYLCSPSPIIEDTHHLPPFQSLNNVQSSEYRESSPLQQNKVEAITLSPSFYVLPEPLVPVTAVTKCTTSPAVVGCFSSDLTELSNMCPIISPPAATAATQEARDYPCDLPVLSPQVACEALFSQDLSVQQSSHYPMKLEPLALKGIPGEPLPERDDLNQERAENRFGSSLSWERTVDLEPAGVLSFPDGNDMNSEKVGHPPFFPIAGSYINMDPEKAQEPPAVGSISEQLDIDVETDEFCVIPPTPEQQYVDVNVGEADEPQTFAALCNMNVKKSDVDDAAQSHIIAETETQLPLVDQVPYSGLPVSAVASDQEEQRADNELPAVEVEDLVTQDDRDSLSPVIPLVMHDLIPPACSPREADSKIMNDDGDAADTTVASDSLSEVAASENVDDHRPCSQDTEPLCSSTSDSFQNSQDTVNPSNHDLSPTFDLHPSSTVSVEESFCPPVVHRPCSADTLPALSSSSSDDSSRTDTALCLSSQGSSNAGSVTAYSSCSSAQHPCCTDSSPSTSVHHYSSADTVSVSSSPSVHRTCNADTVPQSSSPSEHRTCSADTLSQSSSPSEHRPCSSDTLPQPSSPSEHRPCSSDTLPQPSFPSDHRPCSADTLPQSSSPSEHRPCSSDSVPQSSSPSEHRPCSSDSVPQSSSPSEHRPCSSGSVPQSSSPSEHRPCSSDSVPQPSSPSEHRPCSADTVALSSSLSSGQLHPGTCPPRNEESDDVRTRNSLDRRSSQSLNYSDRSSMENTLLYLSTPSNSQDTAVSTSDIESSLSECGGPLDSQVSVLHKELKKSACNKSAAKQLRTPVRCSPRHAVRFLGPLRSASALHLAARNVKPCANSDEGCDLELPPAQLSSHELLCPYNSVNCPGPLEPGSPALCSWKGQARKLYSHVKEVHRSSIEVGGMDSQCSISMQDIFKLENVFFLKEMSRKLYAVGVHLNGPSIYVTIQYIASTRTAERPLSVTGTLEMLLGSEASQPAVWKGRVTPIQQHHSQLLASGKCLVVPIASLNGKEGANITFYINVQINSSGASLKCDTLL